MYCFKSLSQILYNIFSDEITEDSLKSIDQVDENLSSAVEGLNNKSVASRVKCWTGIASVLKAHPSCHVIANYRLTLTDHLEKALKRPKPEEQAVAADVAALLAIQVIKIYSNVICFSARNI